MKIERGGVWLAELDPTRGHEIRKTRPVVVVTNDIANLKSSLVTVIPLTSQKLDRIFRIDVLMEGVAGLDRPSKTLVDQIRTLDKTRLVKRLAKLPDKLMAQIDERLRIHLGLD